MDSHGSQPLNDGSFIPASAGGPSSDAQEAEHMINGDFTGLEGEGGELHPDLAALAQSLPFSASEMNLAGMVGQFSHCTAASSCH
jgi:hypothetical protein